MRTMHTHIQFSGSLQPEDAQAILDLLKPAIERPPERCGAYLRVTDIGDGNPTYENGGLVVKIDELLNCMEEA